MAQYQEDLPAACDGRRNSRRAVWGRVNDIYLVYRLKTDDAITTSGDVAWEVQLALSYSVILYDTQLFSESG